MDLLGELEPAGVIEEADYCWASSLCILGSFLNVKIQIGKKLLGLLKFQIFFQHA